MCASMLARVSAVLTCMQYGGFRILKPLQNCEERLYNIIKNERARRAAKSAERREWRLRQRREKGTGLVVTARAVLLYMCSCTVVDGGNIMHI